MSRSYKPELLDLDNIPDHAFGQMLKEINNINTWLGGHNITIQGFKTFDPALLSLPVRIAEIGCGGGDNLCAIYNWSRAHKIEVELTGIDIRPECIAYAKQHTKHIPVRYIVSDYKQVIFEQPPHIIFNALFCHHFKEDEIVFMLKWMHDNSSKGFFINDLHRHPVAYGAISVLTKIFSRSFMVRYDAPLSVRRGFTAGEWKQLLTKAGLINSNIEWKWAFRHLITFKHRENVLRENRTEPVPAE